MALEPPFPTAPRDGGQTQREKDAEGGRQGGRDNEGQGGRESKCLLESAHRDRLNCYPTGARNRRVALPLHSAPLFLRYLFPPPPALAAFCSFHCIFSINYNLSLPRLCTTCRFFLSALKPYFSNAWSRSCEIKNKLFSSIKANGNRVKHLKYQIILLSLSLKIKSHKHLSGY
jgi:hypothetical protein